MSGKFFPKPAVTYVPLGKVNSKTFRRYAGLWDRWFAHGWIGQFYLLWLLGLFAFQLGILTQGVQVGFFRSLIPTSIEAGVVVIGLVALAIMNHWSLKSLETIVRHGSTMKLSHVVQATLTRANVSNDLTLFSKSLFFVIIELTLMITRATLVRVVPAADAPYDVVVNLNGDANNFAQPMRPLPNTAIGLDYIFHVIVALKCIYLLGVYFERTPIDALQEKLTKLDKVHDDAPTKSSKEIPLEAMERASTQTFIGH